MEEREQNNQSGELDQKDQPVQQNQPAQEIEQNQKDAPVQQEQQNQSGQPEQKIKQDEADLPEHPAWREDRTHQFKGSDIEKAQEEQDIQQVTKSIPKDIIEKIEREEINGSPVKDAVVFFVKGSRAPIVIPLQDTITIGRRTVLGEFYPTLDLKNHDGANLGVSRQHAVIRRVGNGWVLEDLRSTNGTWINEKRLPPNTPTPLANGDTIRLGSFTMTVYM